jgi:hypothetical protein
MTNKERKLADKIRLWRLLHSGELEAARNSGSGGRDKVYCPGCKNWINDRCVKEYKTRLWYIYDTLNGEDGRFCRARRGIVLSLLTPSKVCAERFL